MTHYIEDGTEFKLQITEKRKYGSNPATELRLEDIEPYFQFELKVSGNTKRILDELDRVSATIRRAVREP
jgi:hypothetical protein